VSICLSVRPSAWNYSAPTGRILKRFNIWVFFENLSEALKFYKSLTRITGTLHEDLCTVMTICRPILLGMRNILDKVAQNIKTLILCAINFFQKSQCLGDNVENYWTARQATYTNIIRRMRSDTGYPKLQTGTQNLQYLLIFHGKIGCTNTSQYYVTLCYVALHEERFCIG
jgi:hypothetical protein